MSLFQLVSLVLYGLAGLLMLEAMIFHIPGAQWNGFRRVLFQILYPLLIGSERFLMGSKLRGLLLALILIGLGHGIEHWSQIAGQNF